MKPKKCKSCLNIFLPVRPLQSCCGIPCAITHANKLKAKNNALEEKKTRKAYKDTKEKLKSRQDWLKSAQVAFNSYVRRRDLGNLCISCQKPMNKKINAGHYLSVGAHPELRFEELNCHAQCEYCNTYLSSNAINYRKNLINKIGLEKVEWLEGKHEPKHYSIDDIKEIEKLYKYKSKQINHGL